MLAFNSGTEFFEYFNYKINQFLEVEFYSLIPAEEKLSDSEVESLAEPFFAGHPLLNENPRKCFQIATDLYKWSGDSGMHYLDDLHSLALYNFLEYMRGLVEDDDAQITILSTTNVSSQNIYKI